MDLLFAHFGPECNETQAERIFPVWGTVRAQSPRGPLTIRAHCLHGGSARTVRLHSPRGPSARTVRANSLRGPSAQTARAGVPRGLAT